MPYCLIPKLADKIKEALKNGKINPEALAKMTSEKRREFFKELLGSEVDAKSINALFESKLLLKNQKAGMITWAKTITGIKEEVRRDIISKIERLDKVLDPKEEKLFLEDLASKRLGIDINFKEAQIINDLAKDFGEAKDAIVQGKSPESVNYGAKKVALFNYTNGLKVKAGEISFKEYLKNPLKAVELIASNAKSIKASMDNSSLFRQGWRALFTNPMLWANNAVRSFGYIGKTIKGDRNVLDAIKSEIYNRKNSINDYYRKSKLDIGTGEEAFPTSLPERVPVLGRLYKSSQVAYEGFLTRLRADIFDKLVEIQEKTQGSKLSDNDLRSLGSLVNSLTGRGSLGSFEKVGKEVNILFFSPKFLKSHLDTLTQPFNPSMSKFARKTAALNLVKIIGGISIILLISKMLDRNSVELDSTSSDFGKIRVKDTRFDITGGMGSLVVLASRIARQQSKSSTTGMVNKFGEGYGSMDVSDIITNFIQNKFSPALSLVKDLITQEDFLGNKPTLKGELLNLLTPITAQNAYEVIKNKDSANDLLAIIADGLGISTNTYSYKTNWEQNTSKEIQGFKKLVGSERFNKANEEYNQRVNDWLENKRNDENWQKKSEEDKQKDFDSTKLDIKKSIFRKYNYIPKK